MNKSTNQAKDNYNFIYGNKIKDLRIKNHLTQEQLAQLTGFDTKYISQLETGRYMGPIKSMLKFCEALNVTPNDILQDFIKNDNIDHKVNTFSSDFSKLNNRDKKIVLSLIKSMLSE